MPAYPLQRKCNIHFEEYVDIIILHDSGAQVVISKFEQQDRILLGIK